jgi:DNA repair protein RadA/Sms
VRAGAGAGPVSKARCAAAIPSRDIHWIWEPYLPRHMLSILDGDPGCGKSYLTLALAASLSTGAPFPGMEGRRKRRPCRTLICNCEDPAEEVIIPRLQRLGADLSQVYPP